MPENINLEFFRQALLKMRSELLDTIALAEDSTKPVELDQTAIGRVSRIDAIQQQEMALAAKRRREEILPQIDLAIKKIGQGRFGICIKCDEDIALPRLKLNPVVATCIACAQKKEE